MADDSSEIVKEAQEAVSAVDVTVKGNGPAFYTNMGYANAVAHQQAMNLKIQQQSDVGAAIAGKIAESIIATSPAEGGTDVVILGQLAKLLQQTPPPTNVPTQGT